jgi:membrane protein YfhO
MPSALSLQWPLLAWMLLCAAAGAMLWNRLFRPRLEARWAAVLIVLAILPVLPALRQGYVYGPFDTNVPLLPWVDAGDAGYKVRGHRLNDVTLQFLPWQAEARRQMLQGRAPLLNPFSGAGHPLLGDAQSAPFSFVSLLSLPFDPLEAQALRAFLKLLLALAGTWLAARQLGCSPPASLFAAVAYSFGGSLSVWRLFPHAEVMALWPFAFLASERILKEPRDLRARVLLGFALGGILLAGHPETSFTACLGLGGRWLFALLRAPRDPQRRRTVALLLVLAVLSALGTSFFLLPVAQSVLGSEELDREGGGRDAESPLTAPGGAMGGFLNLVAPGVFGTPQGSREAGPGPLHWLAEGAVGLPALALALGGLFARRRRGEPEIYLILLAAFSYAVHLDPGGLLRPLFALPLISVVAPRYFAFLGGFAVALLAARALDLWAEERDRRFLLGMAAATVLVGAIAMAAHPLALRWWASHGGVAPATAAESARHAWVAVTVAAGLAVVLLLRRFPVAAALLAAALTLGQLWDGLGAYYPVLARNHAYPPVPLLDRLAAEPGPFRIIGTRGVLMPNASTFYRLADVRAHDPMQPARYIGWLHETLDADITRHKRQYGAPKRRHLPFLRLLGTRYLLSGPDLRPGPPWIDRGLFRKTRLWELPGGVRWAFFPETIVPAASPHRAREIVLAARRPLRLASLEIDGPESPRPNGRAQVRRWEMDGDRLRIETKVEEDAWMVISQAAIPGWRARADGRRVRTAIADGALLAVQVPAGTKTLTLRYLPAVWVVGVVLSLVIWVTSALLFLRARRRKRSRMRDMEPIRDPEILARATAAFDLCQTAENIMLKVELHTWRMNNDHLR